MSKKNDLLDAAWHKGYNVGSMTSEWERNEDYINLMLDVLICPYEREDNAKEWETKWDWWQLGKHLAEAWTRGAWYYHRFGGSQKENPFKKPPKKIVKDAENCVFDSRSEYEWVWWESGYSHSFGCDEIHSNEEAEDALRGDRKHWKYYQLERALL